MKFYKTYYDKNVIVGGAMLKKIISVQGSSRYPLMIRDLIHYIGQYLGRWDLDYKLKPGKQEYYKELKIINIYDGQELIISIQPTEDVFWLICRYGIDQRVTIIDKNLIKEILKDKPSASSLYNNPKNSLDRLEFFEMLEIAYLKTPEVLFKAAQAFKQP